MRYSEIKQRVKAVKHLQYRKLRKGLPVFYKDILIDRESRRVYVGSIELTECDSLKVLLDLLLDKETKAVSECLFNERRH